MGIPYSLDLRERVQSVVEGGASRRSAARLFAVSASFAVKLVARIRRTGSAAPARQGRPPGSGKLASHLPALLDWVAAEPDITMPELAAKLAAGKNVTAHPASLSRALLKAGLSYKKLCWPRRPGALTSVRRGRSGKRIASRACARTAIDWSSSMRPARRRR
jgi:transposase